MRIYIKKPTDKLEEMNTARTIKKALAEFGATYTGRAGADWVDVQFSSRAEPETVTQFLAGLDARGVSLQPGDVDALIPREGNAIGRDIARRAVEARMQQSPHEVEMLTVDAIRDVVENIVNDVTAPADLSAADYAAIEKDLANYEPESFLNQLHQETRSFAESLYDTDDPAYQMSEDELRARADAEMRGSR